MQCYPNSQPNPSRPGESSLVSRARLDRRRAEAREGYLAAAERGLQTGGHCGSRGFVRPHRRQRTAQSACAMKLCGADSEASKAAREEEWREGGGSLWGYEWNT